MILNGASSWLRPCTPAATQILAPEVPKLNQLGISTIFAPMKNLEVKLSAVVFELSCSLTHSGWEGWEKYPPHGYDGEQDNTTAWRKKAAAVRRYRFLYISCQKAAGRTDLSILRALCRCWYHWCSGKVYHWCSGWFLSLLQSLPVYVVH